MCLFTPRNRRKNTLLAKWQKPSVLRVTSKDGSKKRSRSEEFHSSHLRLTEQRNLVCRPTTNPHLLTSSGKVKFPEAEKIVVAEVLKDREAHKRVTPSQLRDRLIQEAKKENLAEAQKSKFSDNMMMGFYKRHNLAKRSVSCSKAQSLDHSMSTILESSHWLQVLA